ncbi:MAG TPA: hypothetical protein VFU99_07170 [Gaiellaceae bacterium]|jgi:hypothetical protein|nr:hypothetical protein [Gaiellaceae bacterium]
MRKLSVLIVLVGAVVVGIAANAAMADPNLNNIGAHRHFINGIEVGPRICDHPGNAGVQAAFNQFHANHHSHAVTGGQGPIAPGINDDAGVELTALGGCG